MAIHQLNEEQIRTWTREQKDHWWFTNIFRGNMPQLTLRSGITGFVLGGILASTNLYVGAKTGSTLGVGLTSVILAFALFRVMSRMGLAKDFTILENNAMQSIATAAGYMTSPFISSLAAYMLVTGNIVPWWQMLLWNVVISITGVLVAFPMKRRFINEDQLPFPEGRACGVVLDTLYTGEGASGLFKAKVLAIAAVLAAGMQMVMGEGWMKLIQFKLLRLSGDPKEGPLWHFNEMVDQYYYNIATWVPKIMGTDIRELGLRVSFDLSMIGVGGLMGIRIATSMLIGMIINYVWLAPWMIQLGDITRKVGPDGTLLPLNRGEIVNQWSLWWAIAMMVVGSMVGLFGKPKMIINAFTNLFKKKEKTKKGHDVLKHIEVPLWISFVGVPLFALLGASMAHWFFGASWVLSLVAVPLICVLSIIATNSMALTSWTPVGALSKITQFTMGALQPHNAATNLTTAGMTAEVAGNAANLLSDIKPGYMLGAKPRQQAIGHVIGITAGALASTPLFFALFLPKNSEGVRSISTLVSDTFGMPAALQWKGVADLIAKGLSSLPATAVMAMVIAAVAALLFEVIRIVTKNKFPLSAVSIGLGVVLPPNATICMWCGALFFEIMRRKYKTPNTKGNTIWVECLEPICAGLITGAALIGIGDALIQNVLPIW
ncbi:OPT family oligopeptide transporter [Ereboglobus luteus]|uniref:Peptide transporter n=1 Tax=Ereboglobus luteus TaxID=1796921 RepID=A0A2U8E195_9BACT|nr:OPT/YSL family transporter [Ereboglobus luteus]AWI08639.1 hypothetical protein CKA38_04650 [Ereboglobus luteus]